MSVGVKLAAFALLLAAVFGAGAALGAAPGPIDVGGAPTHVTAPPHEGSHP